MMRRHLETPIQNGHVPPFRVLSPTGPRTPPTPPPPPRAPEPYKIAPQARAHRNTSFVIIAEAQHASPRPTSPTIASGRTSPFRGRGFKGPLPRARSRPLSPDNNELQARRKARIDRKVSISQQNSPNHTHIPQPARSRSISSAEKNQKPQRRPSPKFGRRAPGRYTPSINSTKPGARRPSLQQKVGPPPIKNLPGAKRFVTNHKEQQLQQKQQQKENQKPTRAVSTEVLSSPSKIPLRRGSSKSLISLVARPQETEKSEEKIVNGTKEPDTALTELLKAAGTSSVVSTTTSAASQPLQIDTKAILAERELAIKLADLEKIQQQELEEIAIPAKTPSPEPVAEPPKPAPRNGVAKPVSVGEPEKPAEPIVKKEKPAEEEKKVEENKVEVKKEEIKKEEVKKEEVVAKKEDPKEPETTIIRVSSAKEAPQQDAETQGSVPTESPLESARSTDTGVSVDTVKDVSSVKENSGVVTVKKPAEAIETLSGNVRNGDSTAVPITTGTDETDNLPINATKWQRLLHRWRERLRRIRKFRPKKPNCSNCKWPKPVCPSMRCLAPKRDAKGLAWPGKKTKTITKNHENNSNNAIPLSKWSRIKQACRCTKLREVRWCQRRPRVAPAEAPRNCCPPERSFGALCRGLVSRCKCTRKSEAKRTRSIKAKHSLTSVIAPPLSEDVRPKLPEVLIEHNSVMRGAIPCLPVKIAWFCLIFNVFIPGSGTIFSGLFNLCLGQPRFSATASPTARFGAFIVNVIVGFSQCFTILFCLVGWGWSIWWGVTMLRLAKKYKRFKDSEAAANDPEARGAPETATLPTPGIPSAALRPAERPR